MPIQDAFTLTPDLQSVPGSGESLVPPGQYPAFNSGQHLTDTLEEGINPCNGQ